MEWLLLIALGGIGLAYVGFEWGILIAVIAGFMAIITAVARVTIRDAEEAETEEQAQRSAGVGCVLCSVLAWLALGILGWMTGFFVDMAGLR